MDRDVQIDLLRDTLLDIVEATVEVVVWLGDNVSLSLTDPEVVFVMSTVSDLLMVNDGGSTMLKLIVVAVDIV